MSFRKKLVLIVLVLAGAALLGGCSPGDTAAQSAVSQVGARYHHGGATPGAGFDCSGLTSWAWGKAGAHLPHSAASQYAATRHIGRGDLRPGDLVFYGSGHQISHVAMYVGDGTIVQARKAGTPVERKGVDWWADHRIGFGRVRA